MRSNLVLIPILFLTFLLQAFFGLNGSDALANPRVLSTHPANGATGVSRSLTTVTFTFSQPMDTRSCGSTSTFWGPANCTWSADGLVMTFTRINQDEMLPPNSTISIILNRNDFVTYRDTEGYPLETYTLNFTTAPADIQEVAADPDKGFFWPYFLYVPPVVSGTSVLMVEPNNTGSTSDDPHVHWQAANSLVNWRSSFADELQVPLLVPAFPRPLTNWHIYTHALDRDCLTTDIESLERIDLQLIEMIEDARQRLADMDIMVDSRVFFNGFSASGMFVSRFALLHPDRVKAVASGSPGGWPIVPASEWEGQILIYPVGIGDLQTLIGRSFDLVAYRSVPAFIYIGDADSNDAVPYSDGFSDTERQMIYNLFGAPPEYPYVRWPKAEAIYNLAGTSTQFHIYPDIGHSFSNEIWDDLKTFFSHHKNSDTPIALKDKPLIHKIYFPHVTCRNEWQTEIAIINNLKGIEVRGQLQAYDERGTTLGPALEIVLNPLARAELNVCSIFSNISEIAYMSLKADSFYLSAYTKFFKKGNRVAIEAANGKPRGIFPKRDIEGWTGIAFINTEDRTVDVTLEAIGENGSITASKVLCLPARAKIVGNPEVLMECDTDPATYLRYYANGDIIGFVLNGSADAQMLDGLPATDERLN